MHPPSSSGYITHPSLHLRDANDAHVVFEAVRIGLLPLIKRRLTSDEREQLQSGNVFVWEEAEHKGGLERWTDGKRWSQSRMKGEYLFYEEKIETTEEERQAKAARRAGKNTGNIVAPMPIRRQDRPAKPNGLTKQTYSTHVYLPGTASPRKWHIVAYFSANDYFRLPVVDDYDYLRTVRVPHRIFFSAKGTVKKADSAFSGDEEDEEYSGSSSVHDGISFGPSSPAQNFAAIPDNLECHGHLNPYHRKQIMLSTSIRTPISCGYIQDSNALPRPSTVAPPPPSNYPLRRCPTLPSLAQMGPISFSPGQHNPPQYHLPSNYSPLSSEDRRVLNAFKVVL